MDYGEATVTNTHNYTVISLFSGLGGLDLGFTWEGFRIIFANDSSVYATRSYENNFGHPALCADIMAIPIPTIPKADVVIGGPPCQSFSLVGKRAANDPRGQLVFKFLDIVKHVRPSIFVMENVPGLAASYIQGERLTDVLTREYTRFGYQVGKMQLVATDYLVPQRRKRIILIGSLIGTVERPDPQRFATECYGLDSEGFDISAKAAIGDLGPPGRKGERVPYNSTRPSCFSQWMRTSGQRDVSLHEWPRMSATDTILVTHIPPGGNYKDVPDELATGRIVNFKKTGGRTTTYGRLHPDHPAYTINTYFRRPNVGCHFHYSEPRLITPREAMRFQSIPDWIEVAECAQDVRNALIGNAVPPLMARAIAWSVKKTFDLRKKVII